MRWIDNAENARLIAEMRKRFADGGTDVFVFLGAGLSFGVDRGRVMFEREHEYYDDGQRFPSWPLLVTRMRDRVSALPEFAEDADSVHRFFTKQDPIDCAELFRQTVGTANYYAFLREQFEATPHDAYHLTKSHHELAKLPLRTIFTTNYDELIELAFRSNGHDVRVSSTPGELIAHRQESERAHLVFRSL